MVETPTPHIAPVIDIMEALKRAWQSTKSQDTAVAAAGEEEAEQKRPCKPWKKKRRQ